MFDYTFNYIYGILGYNGWAWYYRLLSLLFSPMILIILIIHDIIELLYNMF